MPEIDISELPDEVDTYDLLKWAAKVGEYRAFDVICRYTSYVNALHEKEEEARREALDL